MPNADDIRRAIDNAFRPLSTVVEFPDRYPRSGDRVGFAVFDDEHEIYRSPERPLGWRKVESWIEEGRQAVEAAGYRLGPWQKPKWFNEFLAD